MEEQYHGLIFDFGKFELKLPDQIVYSIIIMIILAIVGILIGRAFKYADYRKPQGKFLSLIDTGVEDLTNYINENLGERKNWSPTLVTMFIYLIFVNTSGIWGIKPPSTNINFVASFSIITIIAYNVVGFKYLGLRYFNQFTGPLPGIGMKLFLTPLEIISHLARPVTLTMRMYGNMLAGTVIIELVIGALKYFSFLALAPLLTPYFDIIDGVLQSFVFVLLTAIYLKEATASH